MLSVPASSFLQPARLAFSQSELHGLICPSPLRLYGYKSAQCSEQLSNDGSSTGRWPTGVRSAAIQVTHSKIEGPPNLEKEPHKYFDQVVIHIRSGDGGHGAHLSLPPRKAARPESKRQNKEKQRPKGKLKRDSDGSLILPMGGHGGDVVVTAKESENTLLEYHKKRKYYAKRGGNVDAMGHLTGAILDGASAPTLRLPVPVGTVIKRKRGGKLLADLARPGDEILVARGGRGGISLVEIPKSDKFHLRPRSNAPTMNNSEDKALILGAPGEEVALELTLRVVADVGLVGLPNAGKSSLLAAVTRAKPEIAEYPFTTLMPNLGHLHGDPEREDGGCSRGPTMADLPGLIKGAHLGKGLGRMFLRHLRRTRIVIHVVDASTEEPLQDYKILREELLMYNPDYLHRPHVVVLNKLDLPEAKRKFESIRHHILQVGYSSRSISGPLFGGTSLDNEQADKLEKPLSDIVSDLSDTRELCSDQKTSLDDFPCAAAVIGISALKGLGIDDMLKAIRLILEHPISSVADKATTGRIRPSRREMLKPAQWEI